MISWILPAASLVCGLAALTIFLIRAHLRGTRYAKFRRMDGKTVIITGGNAGIGRATAKELAKRGARVILACRNLETAKKARDEIAQETDNREIFVKKLDLSSQKSIRLFAEDILQTEARLDVLIHNAGIACNNLQTSEDNIELTMATNHFGPFLLTHLLIDLLKKSAPSRIVVVASELYRLVSLNVDNVNPTRYFLVPRLYYVSKYANICFTRELARRIEGSGVTANCLHPGLVNTGIWESAPPSIKWAVRLITKGFFKNPEQGCQTSVFVACSEEVNGVTGKYFSDCKEKGLSSGARSDEKAKKLWDASERLVNFKENDPKI